jgi:hypothetical protein
MRKIDMAQARPGRWEREAAASVGLSIGRRAMWAPTTASQSAMGTAAAEVLPQMLASENRWKAAATSLAARINRENGLDAAETFVLGPRESILTAIATMSVKLKISDARRTTRILVHRQAGAGDVYRRGKSTKTLQELRHRHAICTDF